MNRENPVSGGCQPAHIKIVSKDVTCINIVVLGLALVKGRKHSRVEFDHVCRAACLSDLDLCHVVICDISQNWRHLKLVITFDQIIVLNRDITGQKFVILLRGILVKDHLIRDHFIQIGISRNAIDFHPVHLAIGRPVLQTNVRLCRRQGDDLRGRHISICVAA